MMNKKMIEKIYIKDELSILYANKIVLNHVKELGFGLIDQTKIITATSELTRNIEKYSKKGIVFIEHIERNGKLGIRLTFKDYGPGIYDIDAAMQDGYSTAGGLGLGLPGTKRLMDEFQIYSKVGEGTTITIVKWVDWR